MTTADIKQRVREGADARFGDTVDKLLLLLRRQHSHKSHFLECDCEYCRFILTKYTDSKLAFHRTKRRMDRIDYWGGPDWELTLLDQLKTDMIQKFQRVNEMKAKKLDMWKDVL